MNNNKKRAIRKIMIKMNKEKFVSGMEKWIKEIDKIKNSQLLYNLIIKHKTMSKYKKSYSITGAINLKRKPTIKTRLIRKMNKIYKTCRSN